MSVYFENDKIIVRDIEEGDYDKNFFELMDQLTST